MENETKKKGLFGGVKKVSKCSCGSIQLEEIPEKEVVADTKAPAQTKKGCCDK